ncbi:MAG TPA: hypothetical protein VIL20_19335 [Sandaracinaceae bacterium]
MRLYALFVLALAVPSLAFAQEMSASDRASAVARVRSLASCLESRHQELQRVLSLLRESEQQRERARDDAVRRDAERAIEALIARAADVQRSARACLQGDLPSPGARVVVRNPPPDPAADAVAEAGGTVRTIETDAELTSNVRIVRGEQVDGEGRIDGDAVRRAVRAIASALGRCYDDYLDRGSMTARELDLVFTFSGAGAARGVDVERSGFRDARFEQCVRSAGRGLRVSSGPVGGSATFSYRLRFGR